jgi:hypothetical protein
MKQLLLTFVVFFSLSMAYAGGGYLLVKSEKDLGETRGELYELFNNQLIGFSHETSQFVIKCDGSCEDVIGTLKDKEGYTVKEVTEEEYNELMNQ